MSCRPDAFPARRSAENLARNRDKLRFQELAIRAGWDRVHPALGITKPFYDRFVPAISVSDFRLCAAAERDLNGALDFIAVCRA